MHNEALFKKLLRPDRCQVFLFTCPATLPFAFARHPWFVVNNRGALSRWEVFAMPRQSSESWGHLHKDFYAPTQGINKYPFTEKYLWKHGIRLVGLVEGDAAERMAAFIATSPQAYPYCDAYSLQGPNSNTYGEWVLAQFPESNLHLPWNSFGKGYNRHKGRA